MADPSLVPLRKTRPSPTSQTILREQAGHELVFAIVGHIGSGVSHTAEMLKTALEDTTLPGGRFDVTLLKARDQIVEWAVRTGRLVPKTGPRDVETITELQDLGDGMRGAGDHAAVANALIRKIRLVRAQKQGVAELENTAAVIPDGTRRAFILDSIRHPMEVQLLRSVYRNAFALIGVVCDEQKRVARLVKKLDNAGEHKAQELMQRDAKAPQKNGQRVADAFHLADVFLDNSADRFLDAKGTRENPDWDVADQLSRLVALITHSAIVRPRPEETAMHVAYGAQVRSACLSRQVGASIIDDQGVLVSTGTNEVPRAGGGVYGAQLAEGDEDHRCAYRGLEDKPFCANTREQNAIANELIAALVAKGLVSEANREAIFDELRRSRIGSLLEFSRAVHAEMDALLNAARSGKSTRATRMFVTTFPCHYCARHIVAAGVDEVQSIEPYPKSQALKLHDDSIGVDASKWEPPSSDKNEDGRTKQVLFRPFRGVAPRMYARAFLKDRDLKDDATGVMTMGEPEWGRASIRRASATPRSRCCCRAMEPSMADHTKLPYLRLVTDAQRTITRGSKARTQLEMFLDREPNLLGLFLLAPARMRLFAKAIDSTRPRYVFDLRVLPAFEGAGNSRRSLFRLMESTGCTYVDAMGRMGGRDRRSALLHSGAFEECVRSVCGNELVGPMFFLFQSGEDLAWSCSVLPKMLQPAPRRGWSVHVLGAGSADSVRLESEIDTDTVQPWTIGEVLYVVASPKESTGWLLDDRGRPTEPVNLPRGSSVRVVALQVGQWTDVQVLGGPHQGHNVRLASNAHIARLVK